MVQASRMQWNGKNETNGSMMMKRNKWITRVLLALLISMMTVSVAVASALTQPKADGLIGEQANGYIGLVRQDISADIRKLVKQVNAKRKAGYQKIAADLVGLRVDLWCYARHDQVAVAQAQAPLHRRRRDLKVQARLPPALVHFDHLMEHLGAAEARRRCAGVRLGHEHANVQLAQLG